MKEYAGRAAIGHVRYATCGADDRNYAQPFERPHIKKHKWFSFAFNGQLANYSSCGPSLLVDDNNHLARETDTEVFMHEICQAVTADRQPPLIDAMREIGAKFDGAYSMVFLDALGDMIVARDPLGIKPLCYAVEGPLFAAASESVALMNLGFAAESIKSVPPGQAIIISDGRLEIQTFAAVYAAGPLLLRMGLFRQRGQHAGRPQRLPGPQGPGRGIGPPGNGRHRRRHGRRARARHQQGGGRRDGLRLEGSLRRRADPQSLHRPDLHRGQRRPQAEGGNQVHPAPRGAGRQAGDPGRRLDRPRHDAEGPVAADPPDGLPREIHVRVACPPIIAPCFYGIDMSTVSELFAAHFLQDGPLTPEIEARMAARLGADSLRYLPVEAVARAIGFEPGNLCQACITGRYPTPCGQQLAQIAIDNDRNNIAGRTYETVGGARQLFLRQGH